MIQTFGLAALLSVLLNAVAGAQTEPEPQNAPPEFRVQGPVVLPTGTIAFTYDNPRVQPARFELTLRSDGSGHFVSHVGAAPLDDIANLPPQGQERDVKLADDTRDRLFSIAAREHWFAIKCEAGGKVAFQGTKTLAYDGPEGHGSCTYNYSADQKIDWITTQLTGLATTLEEGRRLAVELEHARLALDTELDNLATLAKDNQATEIQTIAPVLAAIVADERVMVRARRRAQALLDGLPASPAR